MHTLFIRTALLLATGISFVVVSGCSGDGSNSNAAQTSSAGNGGSGNAGTTGTAGAASAGISGAGASGAGASDGGVSGAGASGAGSSNPNLGDAGPGGAFADSGAGDCDAQDVTMVGGCEPAPTYFWNGSECLGQSGCSCEGADCDATFTSQADCEASFGECIGEGCGGFLGNTCSDEEYCAYEPGEYCGAADASSTCKPRPSICTRELTPACGCDGMTYSNPCEANAAGVGLLNLGGCEPGN